MPPKNYKLASLEHNPQKKRVFACGHEFGPGKIQVIAGPCAVESRKQLFETAEILKESGINIMRASAFKPRTHPYSFQGLGSEGLDLLNEVGSEIGLVTETEVTDTRQIAEASEKVDILRVGARNMQNFELLKELSKVKNAVILKNGMASTFDEFLSAAEYLLEGGNENVILCWRGTRSFEPTVRFGFDAMAIPALKSKTNLPVIADPSHPTGNRDLVLPLSKAAIASGADGLIVEAHSSPDSAKTDAAQQLKASEMKHYLEGVKKVAGAVGREVALF